MLFHKVSIETIIFKIIVHKLFFILLTYNCQVIYNLIIKLCLQSLTMQCKEITNFQLGDLLNKKTCMFHRDINGNYVPSGAW